MDGEGGWEKFKRSMFPKWNNRKERKEHKGQGLGAAVSAKNQTDGKVFQAL